MTHRIVFGVIVIGLMATTLTSGQMDEDSISLGSLKLTLGTSEQAIRKELPREYHLDLNGPDNDSAVTGLVFSKPGRLGEYWLGQVTFQRGKLVSVTKDSGLGSRQDSVPFARTLYSLIYRYTRNQQRSCDVKTWQKQDAVNAQTEGLMIRCGAQIVEVLIVHPDEGQPSVQINERLER